MTADLFVPDPATELTARRELARVPITPPPGPFGRVLGWVGRRMAGRGMAGGMDNAFALAHQRQVLVAVALFERRVARWRALDGHLMLLATLAAAREVGCGWCIDYGFREADRAGLDLAKAQEIGRWRDSPVFSSVERRVVGYAVAMTATPPTVDDAMVAALRADLGDAALVELTMMVAVENQRSRFNAALGLVAQGFSASCRLPG
ncbi:carboxymuconolactone decarboxylase family protein [Nakamurella flavida]|uniref:Carboxymuconolactone decarboxylase family protein n=1 Tax=Nakamurella flavida TaxID=363630 RepID=A0A938YSN7_9ACTN|nr:carboxymuconolactone decarboxylase family protein [Nakamurella flavida]MBM9478493.1 carboxymuconolactone decarboxylase family protein [Nakamurella flavida]MDP9777681.1 alkylhydroperoxidase family enzyme [Nakamurella flavida]